MLRPTWRTAPVPWHLEHRSGEVPGRHPVPEQVVQVVRLRMVTDFEAPFTTSSSVTSNSRARSLPRRFSVGGPSYRKRSCPQKDAKRSKGPKPPTGTLAEPYVS